MLPNDSKLYITEDKREYLYPLTKVYDPMTAFEKGGFDVSDPTLGSTYQNWFLTYENKNFILRSEDGKQHILKTLTEDIEITKLSFSFDQNMKVAWGYSYKLSQSQSQDTYFYWYNTKINDYEEIYLNYSKDITVTLDDKRSSSNRFNDILLTYIDIENWLTVRIQRDRYLKAVRLKQLPEDSVISNIGMTRDYRFQYEIRTVSPVKHKNNKFQLGSI